jgi:hypothetical protein
MDRVRRSLRRGLRIVNAAFERLLPAPPANAIVGDYQNDDVERLHCLVATKKGLYLLENGRITRLLDGYFYGLTRARDDWYAFQKFETFGRIIRFTLTDGRMTAFEQLTTRLSPGCHQIDFVNGRLHVMDTYNNGLLIFRPSPARLELVGEHYPPGRLVHGVESANYAHMNSIWRCESGMYVLLHNATTKTGRPSEIARIDESYQIVERIPTGAANGHNILLYDGRFMFCDSQAGTLVSGTEPVFRCERFTRGLSVTDDYVVVGRSEYGDRSERERLAGGISVLDHDFRLLSSIDLPGMVQEIRSIDGREYGLSGDGRHMGFLKATPVGAGPRHPAASQGQAAGRLDIQGN